MVNQPGRKKRPSYETDKAFIERLFEQSGLSLVNFAASIPIADSTLRSMLAGGPIDAKTLVKVAKKFGIHWHALLSAAERTRIGVGQPAPVSFASVFDAPVNRMSSSTDSRVSSRLFQLPAALADFTGREQQIVDIGRRLCAVPSEAGLPALRGMGGVGKTSLAIRVAHEVKASFPDAHLFLDLRGTADGVKERPLTPAEAMSRVIRALQPDTYLLPDNPNELASLYRGVLAGKRALIVLDNVGSEMQIRTLLTAQPPVRFLITSRSIQFVDGVVPIPLDPLPFDEACALFRRTTTAKLIKTELSTIVNLCGRLPLALRVAGDFLRLKEDWPVYRFIAALQQERLRWLKVGTDPERDVEAVLKLSSAQLVRDSVDRATRWHRLCVFQADFDLAAAAAAWETDTNDLSVLSDLSDLQGRSLISFDPNTRRYHLHDLMRPIAEGLFA
jgi:NB-ARC domain